MELTLEAYHNIFGHIGTRSDIAILCRVSKASRHAAEQALYRTIQLEKISEIYSLCITLTNSPRLAFLVESLTLSPLQDDEDSDGELPVSVQDVPEDYWITVSTALRNMPRLQFLDIHSNVGPTSECAWVFPKSRFLLRTLYCDFEWDDDLAFFLNAQYELQDLYILDFRTSNTPPATTTDTTPTATTLAITTTTTLNESAMPNLTTLECTFSEAADAIVPYRPITRVKTCFSRTELPAKREELARLVSSLSLSTRSLQSLDIADSSYSELFSMELLQRIVGTTTTSTKLRYLGTLVLPVGGPERLQFYGLLMRLPLLECIEIEVSEWDPIPSTPQAFRALTNELRLYCASITMVIFVHDFERTAVTVTEGFCAIDVDSYTEHLWREF